MSQQQKPPAKCNQCQQEIIFKQEGLKPDGSKKWVRYDYVSPQTKHVCKTLGEPRPEQVAHVSVQNEYAQRQADIALAHSENIAASKALTAAINTHAATLAFQNELLEKHLKAEALKDEKLVELLDAALKSLPMWNKASNMTSEVRQD